MSVVVWGVIIWELVNSPVYPDDYVNESGIDNFGMEETETRDDPPYEKSPPKSQTYRDTRVYKHFQYPTSDCRCQMGVPVQEHTKDCDQNRDKDQEWMVEHLHYQTLLEIRDLEKRLKELGEYSDISVDMSAQREYLRVEKKLNLLKDDLPSA